MRLYERVKALQIIELSAISHRVGSADSSGEKKNL